MSLSPSTLQPLSLTFGPWSAVIESRRVFLCPIFLSFILLSPLPMSLPVGEQKQQQQQPHLRSVCLSSGPLLIHSLSLSFFLRPHHLTDQCHLQTHSHTHTYYLFITMHLTLHFLLDELSHCTFALSSATAAAVAVPPLSVRCWPPTRQTTGMTSVSA
mgnify:CR=1 FL=1